MTLLSAEQIYALARSAGFSPDQAVSWTGIALAESGGETGSLNSRGEHSVGLWQINVAPGANANHWGDLTDPRVNARAAFELSHGGRDLSPWTVTHDVNRGGPKDYRRFMAEAESAGHGAGHGNWAGVSGYGGAARAGLGPDIPFQASPAGVEAVPAHDNGTGMVLLDEHGDVQQIVGARPDPTSPDPTAPGGSGPLAGGDAGHSAATVVGATGAAPGDGGWVDPVSTSVVTGRFGEQRPGHVHGGVDLAQPAGTPILAAGSGVVVDAGPAAGFGNWIRIDHGNGVVTTYGHMYANGIHVHVGQHVTAGQHIAEVGSAGHSSGAHLHFEISTNGRRTDPLSFLSLHGAAHVAVADMVASPYAMDPGLPSWDVDSDHDGLSDGFEHYAGLDPHSADTDHDGLSDGFEAIRSHTNPLSADTDSDGRSDSLEFATGTDAGRVPGVAGVIGSGRYRQLALHGIPDQDHDGLSDVFERSIGSDPHAADTDGDGLPDGREHALGTRPDAFDTDHDGVSDGLEVKLGGDPLHGFATPVLPGVDDYSGDPHDLAGGGLPGTHGGLDPVGLH